MDVPYAAGALCSTAGDLVSWSRALASGRVVRPETYRRMITPAALPSAYPMTRGFGVNIDTAGTHPVLGHSGGITGFGGQLFHYPDDALFVVVLSNTASAPAGRVAADIGRALLNVPRQPPVTRELPTSAAERAAIVGRYQLAQFDGSRRDIAIVEHDGRLALNVTPGQEPLPLQRQEHGVFALARDPSTRIWVERRGTQVTGLVIERSGRPLPARRLP